MKRIYRSIRSLWLWWMGYGEGICPRCGKIFFYCDAQGTWFHDESMQFGRSTCCPGQWVRK